jgi:hypothetical protein
LQVGAAHPIEDQSYAPWAVGKSALTNDPEYPVVLRPIASEDGGGWVALVAVLPGCMSDGAA